MIYLEVVWGDLCGQHEVLEVIKTIQRFCCSEQQPDGVRIKLKFPQKEDGWQLGY